MSRVCTHHDDNPAVAICSVCLEDICWTCHNVILTGHAVCGTCATEQLQPRQTPWSNAVGLSGRVTGFFQTVILVLTKPAIFFRNYTDPLRWESPVLFGLLCVLLGTTGSVVWQYLFMSNFQPVVEDFASQLGLSMSVAVPMFFMTFPIVAPIAFLIHWGLLQTSLRVFGQPATWSQSAMIAGYASAAALLQIVPPILEFPIGHFLSVVMTVHVEITAVTILFGTPIWRSMIIVMIPFLATMMFGAF